MAEVRLTGVNRFRGAAQVPHGIHPDVAEDEFVVFVGRSGLRQVHAPAVDRGARADRSRSG